MFRNIPIITPIIVNALLVIYHGLQGLHISYPLGFAIIILTLVVRLILYPFISQQLHASRKMQHIAPHVARLKEKHKGDAKRIQSETMILYKEHGINPAAGCLPLVIQLPIIWGLYGVLSTFVTLDAHKAMAEVNKLAYNKALYLQQPWDTHFFGIPLGQSPSQLFSHLGILVFLVPVITGVLQFIQSKMMMPAVNREDKAKQKDDFATAFQSQSLYLFPFMIAFFSFQFPMGLSLYWNTFTIFGILQQYQIQRYSQPLPAVVTSEKKKNKK